MEEYIKYAKYFLPLLIGISISYIFFEYNNQSIVIVKFELVLESIITCVTTLAGFVLTSISIILGMSSSQIMKYIRTNGGMTELVVAYTQALIFSLVVILYSIVLGAVIDDSNTISSMFIAISSGIIVSYLISIIMTCYYLLSILSKLSLDVVNIVNEPSVPPGDFR